MTIDELKEEIEKTKQGWLADEHNMFFMTKLEMLKEKLAKMESNDQVV